MKLAAVITTAAASQQEAVIELTSDNFDSTVAEGNVLVKMVAPWCGHCKRLTPEYEKAAELLAEAGVNVKLATLDATVETEIASRYNVKGYPTLKWFTNGEPSEYDGGRTSDTIVSWIKGMTGPAIADVDSIPEPEAGTPVIAVTGPSIPAGFQAAAEANRKAANFVYMSSGNSSITLQHLGEDVIEFTGDSSSTPEVGAFVRDNKMPLFGELDGDSFQRYSERGIGLMWGLFELDDSDNLPAVAEANRPVMTEVAKGLVGKYSVTYTDTIKFKDAIKGMLDVTTFPAIAMQPKAGDKKKFIYDGPVEAAAILKFVQDIEDGTIKAKLKSEEVPETNDGAVYKAVGSNLVADIFDDKRDVMLAVTAPWCGHCKKLHPEYEKVGLKIQKEEMGDILRVAELDGTANDSPIDEVEWSGFPTMFYVKAGTSTPTKYNGGRTAKDMWKWIKENSSFSADIEARIAANKKDDSQDEGKDDGANEEL